MKMSTKCFLILDSEELEIRSKKSKNVSTDKSERKADQAFHKFLIALGKQKDATRYQIYDKPTLDDYLARFWFGTRKEDIYMRTIYRIMTMTLI